MLLLIEWQHLIVMNVGFLLPKKLVTTFLQSNASPVRRSINITRTTFFLTLASWEASLLTFEQKTLLLNHAPLKGRWPEAKFQNIFKIAYEASKFERRKSNFLNSHSERLTNFKKTKTIYIFNWSHKKLSALTKLTWHNVVA